VFIRATHAYETYEGRYWGPYEPYSYCYYPPNLPTARDDTKEGHVIRVLSAPDLPGHGRYTVDEKDVFSMPLIIPPVRNKQYQRYGGIFSTLWTLAEESLVQCKELFVIGYSFPSTDLATRQMFKDGLRRNQSLSKVVIINPHPESIVDLLINELGVEPSKLEVRKERFEVRYSHKGPLL